MGKKMQTMLFMMIFSHSILSADPVQTARTNGQQAREALVRSHHVLQAYLKRMDPVTKLLPRRGDNRIWYVRDSAADLYPFLVMAAYFTDRDVYHNQMHEILRQELWHSTRLGRLSDNVKPGEMGFEHETADLNRMIFGSCEYVKDGLIPLTELLGHHAWYERMRGIVDDMIKYAPFKTRYGPVPSMSDEVNGEFLQALTRLSYLTREPCYINQAMTIVDFYFNEVIPKSNGLPAHIWDPEKGQPKTDMFNFADHGNEIIGGLSEWVFFLKETSHPRFTDFNAPMIRLMDRLLEVGLNTDGVWISKIKPSNLEIIDKRHAHCWGYLFNAVYTTFLISGKPRFLQATQRALQAVTENPAYLDDPQGSGRNYGSNAYSDAIESAIVFLNRLPNERTSVVLDTCVKRFLGRQRKDGIIEDWYGDGNYVRTALMFAQMKSQGTWLESWRADLSLGAVRQNKNLLLTLECESPWEGVLRFDIPRHRLFFNLPVNYPRLNEFPEWFVVDQDALYRVDIDGSQKVRTGGELRRGIAVQAEPGSATVITISSLPGPPYKGQENRQNRTLER